MQFNDPVYLSSSHALSQFGMANEAIEKVIEDEFYTSSLLRRESVVSDNGLTFGRFAETLLKGRKNESWLAESVRNKWLHVIGRTSSLKDSLKLLRDQKAIGISPFADEIVDCLGGRLEIQPWPDRPSTSGELYLERLQAWLSKQGPALSGNSKFWNEAPRWERWVQAAADATQSGRPGVRGDPRGGVRLAEIVRVAFEELSASKNTEPTLNIDAVLSVPMATEFKTHVQDFFLVVCELYCANQAGPFNFDLTAPNWERIYVPDPQQMATTVGTPLLAETINLPTTEVLRKLDVETIRKIRKAGDDYYDAVSRLREAVIGDNEDQRRAASEDVVVELQRFASKVCELAMPAKKIKAFGLFPYGGTAESLLPAIAGILALFFDPRIYWPWVNGALILIPLAAPYVGKLDIKVKRAARQRGIVVRASSDARRLRMDVQSTTDLSST